jgi:hydroxymethylpyrimidine pyrophosphatase-like HAD family hydrolase
MQIKLIASDMDDTLLNKDCQISPRNEAAIRKALDEARFF